MICLSQHAEGTVVALLVQPRASRNAVVGLQGDELKVALTSPPVDGAANKACIQFFAKLFRIPKSAVSIVAGETSRHKRILLEGVTAAEAVAVLEPLV
ncbi:MAG: YggU family protein [Deltaproteobacteria bacterium]|nr:MAG: YggU family protein [Deltaproteobacteria bacterium]